MRMMELSLLTAYSLLAADAKPPAQAARGQTAFLDESVPTHCSECHSLAKRGTAVGPDLNRLARLNARAIVMAIKATRTQYVQWVKLKNGKEFPGMPGAKEGATIEYYDLSVTPPALKKLDKSEIASAGDNATWKHPPESAGYTPQQLADIIAFIKWASYGDTKSVSTADTE
jgi:mono/diheme cytochrome c family protein